MIKATRQSARQRKGLALLIQHLPRGIRMAEVGCYSGESAEMFFQIGQIDNFIACDIWTGDAEICEPVFDARLVPYSDRIRKLKMTSAEGADLIPDQSLDFVYIDAAHDYRNVAIDIDAWLPKVKPGGMIGGHDYNHKKYPGLVQAVNERFISPDFIFPDSSWLVFDITRRA